MDKIKNCLLYCGLTEKSYKNVVPKFSEENRRNVFLFSVTGAVIFLTLTVLKMGLNTDVFLWIGIVCLLLAVLSATAAGKIMFLSNFLAYVYTIAFLMVGVYIGVSQPTERTTLLLPFYILTSAIFSTRLLYQIIIFVVTEAVYLCLIMNSQSGKLLMVNEINTLIFCAAGIVTAFYLLRMKFRTYETDYRNEFLLERDTLTGLYNRFKYEAELEQIRSRKTPVTVCSFDVNGLKRINDTLGHAAGDELIVAAADCISSVFGKYGKVFRVGGDEFIALLYEPVETPDRLIGELREAGAAKKGNYIERVDISCGIASVTEDFNTSLSEALKAADRLMYEDKSAYYRKNNIDRRRR